MVVLWWRQRAAALCVATVACLLTPSSSNSHDWPTFPHLEPRFERLNITSGDEVKNLVKDWQAELDALDGPGGRRASLRLAENKVLESRFASPFIAKRATCPSDSPVDCQGYGCCYSDETCCY